MRSVIFALSIVAAGFLALPPARADSSGDVRALYTQFVEAQNERDLKKVESFLLDTPTFLWVSDGMSIWGRKAVIDRMSTFQQSEIWHVTPDLTHAVAVDLNDATAFFHLPLELAIGSKAAGPDRINFLVSVLCVKTEQGWRIAALFTTTEKR
jgi:uncharacterized protein (TIGR02246 family)